jgi:hypothetical protein
MKWVTVDDEQMRALKKMGASIRTIHQALVPDTWDISCPRNRPGTGASKKPLAGPEQPLTLGLPSRARRAGTTMAAVVAEVRRLYNNNMKTRHSRNEVSEAVAKKLGLKVTEANILVGRLVRDGDLRSDSSAAPADNREAS